MSATFDLTGKVALVTGASSGLGYQFAKTLAEAGAKVIIAARRIERLEKLSAEIAQAGGEAIPVALDVSKKSIIDQAFAEIDRHVEGLDVVVNNAGVGENTAFLDISEEEYDWMLDTNLKGVFFVAQAAAKRMAERGAGGSIINIASILGKRVGKGLSHYAVAKAGVVQLSRSMALELARHQIRVNSICPGYIKTEINAEFFESEAGERFIKRIPQRRLGQINSLDGALLLLASDAGEYITGSEIVADGGHLVNAL